LGTLDELNSTIGLCRAKYRDVSVQVQSREASDILEEVQQHLFTIQAELAGAEMQMTQDKVDWLGSTTDAIEDMLEPITSFLLPGAHELSAQVDVARTVARRAERRVVEVADESLATIAPETLAYLNRLSSLLYAIVRITNDTLDGHEEAPRYE
jgi:cob(I)alamin adenosyltransferase